MQFRAGILYVVLFSVIAAGAYGVIATADSPEVTIDDADADYVLEEGDEITVGDRTYNVSELAGGSGTLTYIDDEAVLEVEWEDGDSVFLDEDDEYELHINQPEEAEEEDEEDDEADDEEADEDEADDDEEADEDEADEEADDEEADDEETDDEEADDEEADEEEADDEEAEEDEPQPESFTLIEVFDPDEVDFEVVERGEEDEPYVIVPDEENDTEILIPLDEFDELDSQTYEVDDDIEFFDDEAELTVEGEVVEITTETVTVEYIGEEETTYDIDHLEVAIVEGEEFGVYFPTDDQAYLTEDVDGFEAQFDEVETFEERIEALWWVVALSFITASLMVGMAFMPVRG